MAGFDHVVADDLGSVQMNLVLSVTCAAALACGAVQKSVRVQARLLRRSFVSAWKTVFEHVQASVLRDDSPAVAFDRTMYAVFDRGSEYLHAAEFEIAWCWTAFEKLGEAVWDHTFGLAWFAAVFGRLMKALVRGRAVDFVQAFVPETASARVQMLAFGKPAWAEQELVFALELQDSTAFVAAPRFDAVSVLLLLAAAAVRCIAVSRPHSHGRVSSYWGLDGSQTASEMSVAMQVLARQHCRRLEFPADLVRH
jgi:hypothetical protein